MIVLKIIGWILLSVLALVIGVLCVRVHIQLEYSDEQTSVLMQWLFLKFNLYPRNKKEQKQAEEQAPREISAESAGDQTETKNTAGSSDEAESLQKTEITDENAFAAEENDESEVEPAAREAQSSEGSKTEEQKKEEQKKDSLLKTIYNAEGIDGLITIVKKIFSYSKTFFGNLFRGIVVDTLYLEVCCTRSDAAATAIYYGETCGVLFPMLGALASKCKLKKYDVNVYPDYLARFSHVDFFVRFHLTPLYLIGILLAYGLKMLFGILLKMLVKIFLPKKNIKKQEIQNKK